ncbi:hypothetical protein C7S20_18540 [Christiangramia fulva]|uniref:Uncharacterized protein n=1 Tax=Christiangramia fulva TaxID=2126553 RepID=A0A2R3Z9W5_9FLAO|nr:hypothetical protein C7S20_18540 [Christiangramia fulva]
MKKFKAHHISKIDVAVRYLIASELTILMTTGALRGFLLVLILVFTILLVYTGVVQKSLLKGRFY